MSDDEVVASYGPPRSLFFQTLILFRLTFYICALGFTSPMLFDDKKNPFHLMLQHFLQSGGQDAFFK